MLCSWNEMHLLLRSAEFTTTSHRRNCPAIRLLLHVNVPPHCIFYPLDLLCTLNYLKSVCGLRGIGNETNDGCNGVRDNGPHSSGLWSAVADEESANSVNVCQCAWSRSSLRARTSSRPVGANCTSNGLKSWKQGLIVTLARKKRQKA